MQDLKSLLPDSLKEKVYIYSASTNAVVNSSILLNDELKKYHSFKSRNRKQEYLVVRSMIQKIAEQMELQSNALVLKKDENGKPFFNSPDHQYHVSISHSNETVICAICSEFAIGVDIEPAGRQINVDLRSRIMNVNEEEALKGVNTLRIWTIKEALMKLIGKELGCSLRDCVINNTEKIIYSANIVTRAAQVFSCKHENNWLAVAW